MKDHSAQIAELALEDLKLSDKIEKAHREGNTPEVQRLREHRRYLVEKRRQLAEETNKYYESLKRKEK